MPLGQGFSISLPVMRQVSALTGGNWEGVGVRPDVRVPADSALAEAYRQLRRQPGSRAGGSLRLHMPSPSRRAR